MTTHEPRLAERLAGALGRGEIAVEYQPQIDVATGRIVSVEALCRWNEPELGSVPPSRFIPVAEENDLIDGIGDFMVDSAFACASAWADLGIDVELSINVSALQLDDGRFFERFAAGLDHWSLDPTRFTLEITESQAIADFPSVVGGLNGLRVRGVGISIDDYGTGHTSVKQLLSLPASELKLDQSLVQREGESSVALIRSLVKFAHDRGLRIVAEGVETTAQLERMRGLGCDRAQGFLIGRSMPGAAIEALLQVAQRD
jgi:EAL domain-containing protein (putative c-di-GMP-specific phosphodiesterase class I)